MIGGPFFGAHGIVHMVANIGACVSAIFNNSLLLHAILEKYVQFLSNLLIFF